MKGVGVIPLKVIKCQSQRDRDILLFVNDIQNIKCVNIYAKSGPGWYDWAYSCWFHPCCSVARQIGIYFCRYSSDLFHCFFLSIYPYYSYWPCLSFELQDHLNKRPHLPLSLPSTFHLACLANHIRAFPWIWELHPRVKIMHRPSL